MRWSGLSDRTTGLCGIGLVGALAMPAAALPILLNDPFNDGNPATNTGAGAVNPTGVGTQPWAARTGGFGGHTQFVSEGAGNLILAGTADTTPYALGQVNSKGYASYDFYNTTGTSFTYTLGGMTVNHANADARPDIPGADDATQGANGLGAIRYELGVISNHDTNGDAVDELYRSTSGGVFVSIYKNAAGTITGNIRETNDQKTRPGPDSGADAEGTVGVKTLATFTLPGFNGVADFNAELDLKSTGYTLTFDRAVTVLTGSLSGGYGLRADGVTPWFNATSFDTGAFATVSGQSWGTDAARTYQYGTGGYGTMNVGNVTIATIPEPAVMAALAVAPLLMRRRRGV